MTGASEGGLPHVIVVGGGITGLSAGWFLRQGPTGPRARVTVVEAGDRVGGKLRTEAFAGMAVDTGAESLLAARPEAVALCRDLGLEPVAAATTRSGIYSRGDIRSAPSGLLTGVPTDLRQLARSGIVSIPGLLRIPLDFVLPRTTLHGDVSVGDYVATRLGREVADRLVDPLLAGVYAGRSEELSLQMTVPALYRAAGMRKSALDAARSVLLDGRRTMGPRRGPTYVGLEGGVGRLPVALARELVAGGAQVRTGAVAQQLRARGSAWSLVVGDGKGAYETLDADAVLFATPAPVTAQLMSDVHVSAAERLSGIEYASVAVVTLGYPTSEVGYLPGSGFLVPSVEGRAVSSVTFSTSKWHWMSRDARSGAPDGLAVVRATLGRFGDELVDLPDADLVDLAAADLESMMGLPRRPAVSLVTRWPGALPQYGIGHRTRVAEIREWLVGTPGLAVCGAAYEGVGIAACIGSAHAAASTVLQQLAERREWAHG